MRNMIIMFLLFFAPGCKEKKRENLSALKWIDSGLVSTAMSFEKSNMELIRSLKDMQFDENTAAKARVWLPNALTIDSLAIKEQVFIEELKEALKKEAAPKDDSLIFREDSYEAAENLFIQKGKGEELYRHLTNLKLNFLQVNPEINDAFKSEMDYIIRLSSFDRNEQGTFSEILFKNVNTVTALTLLSKYRNDILITENAILEFCVKRVRFTEIKIPGN